MTPPPDYSPASDYHARRRRLAAETRRAFEIAMGTLGAPGSVLDLGCGEGAHLEAAALAGAFSILGIDLAIPNDRRDRRLAHGDLRVPLELGETFDWVLCWEVAEHLPVECAGTLCATIAHHTMRPGGRVIFTAAPPGQRGEGHINCQPRAFWLAHFRSLGLTLQTFETYLLARSWATITRAPWYARNVSVLAWA